MTTIVDGFGAIIDGHRRAAIAAELGIDYPMQVLRGLTDHEKRVMAVRLNAARRHLTAGIVDPRDWDTVWQRAMGSRKERRRERATEWATWATWATLYDVSVVGRAALGQGRTGCVAS